MSNNKDNLRQTPIVVLASVVVIATTAVTIISEKDKDLTAYMMIMSGTLGGCIGILKGGEVVEQWLGDRREKKSQTRTRWIEMPEDVAQEMSIIQNRKNEGDY